MDTPATPQHRYTHGHGTAVLDNHASRTADDSLAFVLPYIRRDTTVLDVGCGPGSITVDLAARVAAAGGSASQVTGVENADAPLVAAREHAAQRGVEARFELGDAHALPFADGSVDVVVAHQVLQHVADPVVALREFGRVAAPGGLVAVRDADYAGMFFHPQPAGLVAWQDGYRRRARANGGEPDAGRRLPDWAAQAGFGPGQLTYSTSTWTYSRGDGAEWLADSWTRRTGSGAGWREWVEDPAAVFVMPHGELLIRV